MFANRAIMLPKCTNIIQILFITVIMKMQHKVMHKQNLTIHHYNNNIQYAIITIIAYWTCRLITYNNELSSLVVL